ncbi:Crp/Fnr family transcriptional regulator [Aureimonas populi]|uniref:Crp/Fnr family transcriptional regulator n=1 Tax=Aureimonas populi TaxID=1701758 RepID=A0ABW5CNY6_9HYPH|nr:Crp/Fnr family transcriptional regulator [Aureimonas populi]
MPLDNHPIIRKIESIARLSDEEREVLRHLPVSIRDYERRQEIVREGESPVHSCLLIEGFASRFKLLEDGRRQILGLHVPGDIPDLQSLHLHRMDHHLATVSPCRLGFIRHHDLNEMNARNPRIAAILWRVTLIDAAIHREWVVRVGQRSARQRMAHFLCEMFLRLEAVGLAVNGRCVLPLTQADMADALALTNVSVNRMLVQLKKDGLIALEGRLLQVLNWGGLMRSAHFDPGYLHLNPERVISTLSVPRVHSGDAGAAASR